MELIGHIMVDSGQVMVGDPCYLEQWGGDEFHSHGAPDRDYVGTGTYDYDGACTATLSKEQSGVLGRGLAIVASSGLGDGSYPVYAEFSDEGSWGRRVSKLVIDFELEDEEEDDETCGFCGSDDVDFDGVCRPCDEEES